MASNTTDLYLDPHKRGRMAKVVTDRIIVDVHTKLSISEKFVESDHLRTEHLRTELRAALDSSLEYTQGTDSERLALDLAMEDVLMRLAKSEVMRLLERRAAPVAPDAAPAEPAAPIVFSIEKRRFITGALIAVTTAAIIGGFIAEVVRNGKGV